MKDHLQTFQTNLERFLQHHRVEINKNPALRHRFYTLCRELGVDPLICKCYAASKGYWANMLDDVQFYYDLAVQATTVCIGLRQRTGGLLEVTDCLKWVNKLRRTSDITREDLIKALDTVKVFGNGISIIEPTPNCQMIVSVPLEFNSDQKLLLERGGEQGFVKHDMFPEWARPRFQQAVDALISEGILWVDQPDDCYWFPAHSLLKN